MSKHILGVLGGMGPQASVRFYDVIIQTSINTYNIQKSADFPHLLINNIPVPDLVKSKEDEEKTLEIVSTKLSALRRQVQQFSQCLAIPCTCMPIRSKMRQVFRLFP